MTHFTLPESYRTYLKDPAVRSAVDHILAANKKLEIPADLKWNQLPDFHAAVLAARQVQCDYATALHGLWNKVWQPALDDCGFADSLEQLSLNEGQEHSTYPSDTYSLWWLGPLDRVYDMDGHKLGLGVTSDPKQAWLAIWLLDGEGKDLTTSLAQGGDWASEPDEDGYLYTRKNPVPISDDGIALDPLNRAARRALQEIGRILGLPEQR